MKNKTSISPEDIFSGVFKKHEATFEPSAWEHMKSLLDEDELKPVLIIPPKSNNSFKLLILFIMTTISVLSIATWIFLSPSQAEESKTELSTPLVSSTTNMEGKTELKGNSLIENSSIENGITNASAKDERNLSEYKERQLSVSLPSADISHTEILSSDVTISTGTIKDTIKTLVQNGKTYKIFVRKIWVPEEYEYIEKPGNGTFKDGFIGIHFTAQRPRQTDTFSAGFNVQFMSGNRIKSKDFGLYGGLDWGMQFYGKGQKSNVVLNNTSQDSGFTRLRTYSMDFLGRMHFEYSKFPIVPYFNVMAGPRIYSTGQTVASYLDMKETVSSSTHNAYTSVSMMYGFGFGARLKISKVVSLDARYEWMNGSPVRLVDMAQSTFNGLNYNLQINKITPHLEQFKIGLLFNISEREYDKNLVKEGYFKEYAYDSVEINASDSNRVFIPCPCVPCATSNNSSMQTNTNERQNSNNTNDPHIPSSTPSTRKSFPGIKPPSKPSEILR